MITKSGEIKDLRVSFVSLVDRAANKRQFLIAKSEEKGKVNWSSAGKIIKADAETHYVTGIVYEPDTPDTDDEFMKAEEIRLAAYWFAKHSNKVDIQHSFVPFENASVVESYIAPCDMTIGEEKVKAGTWIMTVEIKDDVVWKAIEDGEITGFSMGGIGRTESEEKNTKSEGKSVVNTEKSNYSQRMNNQKVESTIYSAFDVFRGQVYDLLNETRRWRLNDEQIVSQVQENAVDFVDDIINALKEANKDDEDISTNNGQKKAKNDDISASKVEEETNNNEKDKKSEENEMTKEEMQELLNEAVNKIVTALTGNKDEEKEEEKKPEESKEENAKEEGKKEKSETVDTESITEQIEKAVNNAVDKVLESRGVVSAVNEVAVEKNESEQHYLHGIL